MSVSLIANRIRAILRLAAFVLLLLALSCASGSDEDGPDSGADAVLHAPDLDAWLAAVANQSDSGDETPVVYSSTLIEQAYRAGDINQDEYYTLRIAAVYDHANLDARFRAEPEPHPSATSLLRELAHVYDTLSASAQAELRPYTLSFEDPESYAYDPEQPKIADAAPNGVQPVLGAMTRPADDGSYFVITGGTEVQREQVLDALELSYEAFLDLGFAEPTDWIPVAIQADLGSPSTSGDETFSMHEGHFRCHIRLRSDLAGDELNGNVAHELFHCFQEYVEANPAVFEAPWVWDSSAVWAEELVYPDANTEHTFDTTHFSNLGRYLFDQGGVREYASYLYWFFLYQEGGKTGEVVHDLYIAIQEDGTLEAIAGRPSFYEEFKRFALWNLNTPPHEYYEDARDAPTLRPNGSGSIRHAEIMNEETFFDAIEVSEGGAMYHVYTVDDRVDKLRFDLTDIRKNASNENGVQVVYRIDGEWTYEDISFRDELVFCRGRESERVDGLIFIISNGELDQSAADSEIDAELMIDTTEWCEVVWHGSVECSWSTSGEGDGRGDDLFVLGDYTSQGTIHVDETFLHDPYDDRFYATEQTVSISSHYEWFFEHEVPTVDTSYIAWERRVEDKNATRTYLWEVPDDCPQDGCSGVPLRIVSLGDGEGPAYWLDEQSFRDVGEYVSVYSAYYVPGSLAIMQGQVAEVRTDEEEHTINLRSPSDSFELTISADGTRMTGSHQTETLTCHAEYVYE